MKLITITFTKCCAIYSWNGFYCWAFALFSCSKYNRKRKKWRSKIVRKLRKLSANTIIKYKWINVNSIIFGLLWIFTNFRVQMRSSMIFYQQKMRIPDTCKLRQIPWIFTFLYTRLDRVSFYTSHKHFNSNYLNKVMIMYCVFYKCSTFKMR